MAVPSQRMVHPPDAPRILEIYAPIVLETAISFEYDVPGEDEMREVRERILEKLERLRERDEGRLLIETKGARDRIGLIVWGLALVSRREVNSRRRSCRAEARTPSGLRGLSSKHRSLRSAPLGLGR